MSKLTHRGDADIKTLKINGVICIDESRAFVGGNISSTGPIDATSFTVSSVQVVGAQGAAVTDAVAATAASLTDSTGGTASQTLAALTNIDTLIDSTMGTADDTIDDVSTVVTGVDGVGSNAAAKADVDARLSSINDNFKELVDQAITQQAFNTATQDALASLADEVNKLITDVADIRTQLNLVLARVRTHGLIA